MTDGDGRSELDEVREELQRAREDLVVAREDAARWRRVAEERRVAHERLRRHPVVAAMVRIASVVLPAVRRARARLARLQAVAARGRRLASAVRALPAKAGAPARLRRLHRAVGALPTPPADPRDVAIVIPTHDSPRTLERLLDGIARTTDPTRVQVVVVDNGAGPATAAVLSGRDVAVVRNEANLSFSEAVNRGVGATDAEIVVLCNDDVLPVDPHWLDRLLEQVTQDVVAAGAHLVRPPGNPLRSAHPEVTTQALGIRFEPDGAGVPHPRNVGGTLLDVGGSPHDVGAATAAVLAIDRRAWDEAGGLDLRYQFGAEDVDLCWRLRQAGGRIRVVPGAVLWHAEGTSRLTAPELARQRQGANWDAFRRRLGPAVRRQVMLDALAGAPVLSTRTAHVAITVADLAPDAAYGDRWTAEGLGRALRDRGLRVTFVERVADRWYDLPPDVDVLVVLLDGYDVRRVARPGLTTVAWVRNWGDRWLAHSSFPDFDLVLASSRTLVERVRARSSHEAVPFPLATDPELHRPRADSRDGVIVPANRWSEDDRGVPALLRAIPELRVLGRGWDAVAAPAGQDRVLQPVPHEDLARLLGTVETVVDVVAEHTEQEGSVNARVFDALAAGARVLSGQRRGVQELFGDLVPTFDTPEEAATALRELSQARVDAARELVLREHTWERRAEELLTLLAERVRRPSVVLRTTAPVGRIGDRWGDPHLADGLGRALRRRGCEVQVQREEEWTAAPGFAADVAVHVLGRCQPLPGAEGQVRVVWVISHPDHLDPEVLDSADLVLAASPLLAERLAAVTSSPVDVLLQATDPTRFRPGSTGASAHPVLFVGNSRGVRRPAVDAAVEAGLPLAVYGRGWDGLLPAGVLRGSWVANDELGALYSAAGVVLNDHWDDMAAAGLVSNRVYDVLASGGVLISDHVAGLEDVVGPGVVATWDEPGELTDLVRTLLDDPHERRRRAELGRRRVLEQHTFDHRAQQLLVALGGLV